VHGRNVQASNYYSVALGQNIRVGGINSFGFSSGYPWTNVIAGSVSIIATGNVEVLGHIVPVFSNMYDLGSATNPFKSLSVGTIWMGSNNITTNEFGFVINTNMEPSVDNMFSLGSPTKQWKDVRIGPGSLYIGGIKAFSSDGTNVMADSAVSLATNLNANGFSITNESVVLVNPPEIPYSSSVTVLVSRGDTQLYKPTGVTTIALDNSVVTNAVVAGISLQLVAFTNSITFSTNNLIFTTNRVPGAGVADFLSTLYTNEGQASIILFNKPYNTTNWHVWSLQ
jgi:hypothetical protein